MSTESAERRPARAQTVMGPHPPPKLNELLPCPRCESSHTKFCYYNNYNLSQPRHFCKSCRRYWTQGGALRNVPVGGGIRKKSKRSRNCSSPVTSTITTAATATTTIIASSSTTTSTLSTLNNEPEIVPGPANPDSGSPGVKGEVLDNFSVHHSNLPRSETGKFVQLLSTQGHGFMGLGWYGSGYGFGFCETGLGFGGRGVWPCPGISSSGSTDGGAVRDGTLGYNTWQQLSDVEGNAGEGELIDGDGLGWPGLAIATPGKGLK